MGKENLIAKEEELNTPKYIFDQHWKSHEKLQEIISSCQLTKSDFIQNLLKWLAGTLDSEYALLLSWPNENNKMQIQEASIKNTPGLNSFNEIICFDCLRKKLNSEDADDEHLVLNVTLKIKELQEVNIQSLIAQKIITKERKFHGKQLLMVCNRKKPAFPGQVYVSYDNLCCDIAKWILQLHIIDSYQTGKGRYADAKKRFAETNVASSLVLFAKTSEEFLAFFDKNCSTPPASLIYDCLNSHISLFNAGAVTKHDLENLLVECEKHRLEEFKEIDSNLVRDAIARGYFVLGIYDNQLWEKGRALLESKKNKEDSEHE